MGAPTDPDDPLFEACADCISDLPGAIYCSVIDSSGNSWGGILEQNPARPHLFGGFVWKDPEDNMYVGVGFCNDDAGPYVTSIASMDFMDFCTLGGQNCWPYGSCTGSLWGTKFYISG